METKFIARKDRKPEEQSSDDICKTKDWKLEEIKTIEKINTVMDQSNSVSSSMSDIHNIDS